MDSLFDSRYALESFTELNLKNFSGNLLEWTECKCTLEVFCNHHSVSNDQRRYHLKFFYFERAHVTIEAFWISDSFFDHAYTSLKPRLGPPHFVFGAQVEKLNNHPPGEKLTSEQVFEFAQVVDVLLSLFFAENCFSDLQSSNKLPLVVSNWPINPCEQFFFNENGENTNDLIFCRNWLQQKEADYEWHHLLSPKQVETESEVTDKIKRTLNTYYLQRSDKSPNFFKKMILVAKVSSSEIVMLLHQKVKQRAIFVSEKKLFVKTWQLWYVKKTSFLLSKFEEDFVSFCTI